MQTKIAAWPLENTLRSKLLRTCIGQIAVMVALPSLLALLPAAAVAQPVLPTSTSLAQVPLSLLNAVEPAIVFAIDDSGSMDWEVLLSTTQGEAYWNPTAAALIAPNGVAYDQAAGTPFNYLFPFGKGNGAAMPPTVDFATMRNAAFNPLYYNPKITYVPWSPSWHNGALVTYPQAQFSAARTHPIYGATSVIDLGASQPGNFQFPVNSVAPKSCNLGGGLLANLLGVLVNTAGTCTLNFVPATYYVNDAACAAPSVCVKAPNGVLMRQVVLSASSAEAQNFANWFTYYRQRVLLLASSMSAVLPNVGNLRAGGVKFSSPTAPSMVDFSSATPASNQKALLDLFYNAVPTGNTPTVTTLKFVGTQFQNDTAGALIQQACQRNAVMVVTDGFANDYPGAGGGGGGRGAATAVAATLTPQVLSPQFFSTGGAASTPPYDTTWQNTLAGVAATFYAPTTPLGNPAFATGLVPADANPNVQNADLNTNLHLNTYAMTLGAKGTIFGTGSAADLTPFASITAASNWPQPANNAPSAIDDLYHATINGRGKTVVVTDSTTAIASIKNILADLLNRSSASAPVVLSNPNIAPGDNTAYLTSFNPSAWFGDLKAVPVDPVTGKPNVIGAAPLWSLQAQLDVPGAWTTRLFATTSPSGSTAGQGAVFPSGIDTSLLKSGAVNDGACVANYVMGDRSNEVGTIGSSCPLPGTYRQRIHVLGDLVDAAPVLVKNLPSWSGLNDASYNAFASQIANRASVIYQGGNDGMLHAVDATSGTELWNYIPGAVLSRLPMLVNPAYSHTFMVDGTPRVRDVKLGSTWSTLLVGGLRAGGAGYYALDVTDPQAANAKALVAKVKWEFPNAGTPAASVAGVGYSYGQPLIANTAAGWVVLVTSGYDNPDYQGHLFVLDPATGNVLADLNTGQGSSLAPAGLANFTAFAPDGFTATRAYAGDLNGNLFAFDLTGADPTKWAVRRLALLTDAAGKAQPITATPAVTLSNGNPYVYVGTGRLLDRADVVANPQAQSVYALVDDGVTSYGLTGSIRSAGGPLLQQTLTLGTGGARTASQNVLSSLQRGWYLDLPAGEEVTVDMLLAGNTLVFNTNAPATTACASSSYQYQLDAVTGGMQAAALFPTGTPPFAGKQLGTALASAPTLAILPSGQWVSETHLTNDAVDTSSVPPVSPVALRKQGWREIRQ